MSITFSSDRPGVKLGYQMSCYAYGSDANWQGPLCNSVEEAVQLHLQAKHDPIECDGAEQSVFPTLDTDQDPQLRVSNGNGVRLLQTLGLSTEDDIAYSGSVPADDFLGRILIALALEPVDEGLPLVESITSGGARLVDCGRPEGYIQDKLKALLNVVEFAKSQNSNITWG